MNNKIVLLGLRDLRTDEDIKPMREYGIFLIAERVSVEKPDSHSDDKEPVTYKLKISHIEQVMDLKEKRAVKALKGFSSSQQMRWLTEQKLSKEDYDPFMRYLMSRHDELTENYLETLK